MGLPEVQPIYHRSPYKCSMILETRLCCIGIPKQEGNLQWAGLIYF